MDELSLGQEQAIAALTDAAESSGDAHRISATTLRLIVQLAWEHQFESENRSQARRMLAEILSSEVVAAENRRRL